MKNKHPFLSLFLGLLCLFTVALGLVKLHTLASAQVPDKQINRPTILDGLSPLVIPAAAFSSDGNSPANYLFDFWGGYFRGGPNVCAKAPVYLPNNAWLSDASVSVYDNDANSHITVVFMRVSNVSSNPVMLKSAATSDAFVFDGITILDLTPTFNQITTYPHYSYYVGFCALSPNTRLYSVRIYYKMPVFLPVIIN